MKVVSVVASQVDTIRNRLFLASISRSEKVCLYTVRILVPRGNGNERFRAWILVRANIIAEAESLAEMRLKEILLEHIQLSVAEKSLKQLKPRELTLATLNGESEGVLQLLQKMRREAMPIVSAVERTYIG